ncbi:hypothetical protein QW46_17660 [Salmonella enterica]|nr:hypothetical protein [Salmonella enterica]
MNTAEQDTYDGLPIDVEDAINNIEALIAAARVFEGTDNTRELSIRINEFVHEYVSVIAGCLRVKHNETRN